nr:hypothetical protein [Lapidilactobacillus achengensis]
MGIWEATGSADFFNQLIGSQQEVFGQIEPSVGQIGLDRRTKFLFENAIEVVRIEMKMFSDL